MDLENVIYKLRRILDNKINALSLNITSGGVDNMETYKYIIGQINALEATKQDLSDLLEHKELNDGTVVDIAKGKPKA